jgi:hypothetical protein
MRRYYIPICAAATLLLIPSPSTAQTAPASAESPSPFGSPALSSDVLGRVAGREDRSLVATSQQTAGVSRNSVGDNSSTGAASIADNAFQNLSGLSLVNVNTGNNVAINSAMNVTISIAPIP